MATPVISYRLVKLGKALVFQLLYLDERFHPQTSANMLTPSSQPPTGYPASPSQLVAASPVYYCASDKNETGRGWRVKSAVNSDLTHIDLNDRVITLGRTEDMKQEYCNSSIGSKKPIVLSFKTQAEVDYAGNLIYAVLKDFADNWEGFNTPVATVDIRPSESKVPDVISH